MTNTERAANHAYDAARAEAEKLLTRHVLPVATLRVVLLAVQVGDFRMIERIAKDQDDAAEK